MEEEAGREEAGREEEEGEVLPQGRQEERVGTLLLL